MTDNKYIREALQFQELSDEEKQRRGILARLYGPCASIIDATRNGRKYNDELWENVFTKNDIVKEMFANGGIPMEMDHPVDREETCSEKIAAMLPEAPKRDQDGHLICYVDLIDTPCGKIAYQLAKYGFKLGISSRGTGDLITDADGNESVDPNTYDFTTFDLVLLPAVKDARLSMCESYDTKLSKFKKALTESYNNASVEDRRIMEDTLKDLDIDIDASEENTIDDIDIADIPELADEAPDLLTEDVEEETEEDEDKASEEDEEAEEENTVDEEDVSINTVQDLINMLADYDPEAELCTEPITVKGDSFEINTIILESTDDGVTLKIDCSPIMDDDKTSSKEDDSDEADVAQDEAAADEIDMDAEEADDIEIDGMLESLKEAVRQKDALEKELKDLKSNKTVSDAEVAKLHEDLERYQMAFARTSELATNAKKFESEVKSLTEQVNQKDTQIKKLESIQTNTVQLTESRDANAAKVKTLTEKLLKLKDELDATENQLNEQATSYRKQLKERTDAAKAYKAKFTEVLDRYIESKASMLGVRPTEITSRLDENYSIDDIDQVYNQLLTEGVTMSRVPGIAASSRVKINEAKQANKVSPDAGYDVDESLLELAGLK